MPVKLTRLSFLYLIGYLAFAGIALLVDPDLALSLLFSTGEYGVVLPRLVALLLLGLALLVAQIMRHEVEVPYPTTLAVRGIFLAGFVGLYFLSKDPLFLALFGIVGLGVALTGVAYLRERGARGA